MKYLLLISLLLVGCTANFQTGVQGCDNSLTGEQGLLSKQWQGSTYVIKAFHKTYCDIEGIENSHKIEGETITLYTKIDSQSQDCTCPQVFEYKLENLEFKDYVVRVLFSKQ